MHLIIAQIHGQCNLPHCFDLTVSGERLGEFAAILTALTFTAIIFLADQPHKGKRHHEETQIMLLAAFVALATAAYLFSGVAAEEGEGPRTAFEAFCASLALSIALQLLFLGIVQLMRYRKYRSATTFTARVSKWFVGPTIFAFMSATAVGAVELYASSSAAYRSTTSYICGGLFVTLAFWMWLITQPRGRDRLTAIRPTAAQWAGGCIGIVAIASVLTLVWAEVPRGDAMPAFAYVGFMVLLLIATMGFTLQLTDTGKVSRGSSAESDSKATESIRDGSPKPRE
jgi:uncharacterized membrane protein YeiB